MRQLRYFVAITQAGSFSRAATELYMTQPPLSAAIAQLEQEIGTRLLIRSPRGVSPTTTGREFLRYAERILAEEREIRRRMTALEHGLTGTIEIGCSPALTSSHLPAVLGHLATAGAEVDVHYQQADPLAIIDAVRARRLDVGLLATAAAEDLRTLYHPELDVETLEHVEMVIALPPDENNLPPTISLRDVATREFAIPFRSMRHGVRASLMIAFDRAGLAPPRVRDVPSMLEALPLVTAGLVVAVVPLGFCSLIHPDRVAFRRLVDGPDPLEVYSVARSEDVELPVVRRFREAARAASNLSEST
ncbi:LysR family transcriptional regulator [Microbacterium kribbense]